MVLIVLIEYSRNLNFNNFNKILKKVRHGIITPLPLEVVRLQILLRRSFRLSHTIIRSFPLIRLKHPLRLRLLRLQLLHGVLQLLLLLLLLVLVRITGGRTITGRVLLLILLLLAPLLLFLLFLFSFAMQL